MNGSAIFSCKSVCRCRSAYPTPGVSSDVAQRYSTVMFSPVITMSRLHSLQRKISVSPVRYAHHLPHRQRAFCRSWSSAAACTAREGDPFGDTTAMCKPSLCGPHPTSLFHIPVGIPQLPSPAESGTAHTFSAQPRTAVAGALCPPAAAVIGAPHDRLGDPAEWQTAPTCARRR